MERGDIEMDGQVLGRAGLRFLRAAGASALLALSAVPAHAVTTFVDTAEDGAKYGLSWSNAGPTYTFTFTADFTGVTTSAALGDWIRAISIASIPGNVNWGAGSVTAGPGGGNKWSIFTGVVTNSSGCPVAGAASKDWCIGAATPQGGPIQTGSQYSWTWTMNLLSGTPSFTAGWSYKFVTAASGAANADFGGYQISRKFGVCTDGVCTPGDTVPEPGTLALLGLGLLGLGLARRRRTA
jgi:hypothetical protein